MSSKEINVSKDFSLWNVHKTKQYYSLARHTPKLLEEKKEFNNTQNVLHKNV